MLTKHIHPTNTQTHVHVSKRSFHNCVDFIYLCKNDYIFLFTNEHVEQLLLFDICDENIYYAEETHVMNEKAHNDIWNVLVHIYHSYNRYNASKNTCFMPNTNEFNTEQRPCGEDKSRWFNILTEILQIYKTTQRIDNNSNTQIDDKIVKLPIINAIETNVFNKNGKSFRWQSFIFSYKHIKRFIHRSMKICKHFYIKPWKCLRITLLNNVSKPQSQNVILYMNNVQTNYFNKKKIFRWEECIFIYKHIKQFRHIKNEHLDIIRKISKVSKPQTLNAEIDKRHRFNKTTYSNQCLRRSFKCLVQFNSKICNYSNRITENIAHYIFNDSKSHLEKQNILSAKSNNTSTWKFSQSTKYTFNSAKRFSKNSSKSNRFNIMIEDIKRYKINKSNNEISIPNFLHSNAIRINIVSENLARFIIYNFNDSTSRLEKQNISTSKSNHTSTSKSISQSTKNTFNFAKCFSKNDSKSKWFNITIEDIKRYKINKSNNEISLPMFLHSNESTNVYRDLNTIHSNVVNENIECYISSDSGSFSENQNTLSDSNSEITQSYNDVENVYTACTKNLESHQCFNDYLSTENTLSNLSTDTKYNIRANSLLENNDAIFIRKSSKNSKPWFEACSFGSS